MKTKLDTSVRNWLGDTSTTTSTGDFFESERKIKFNEKHNKDLERLNKLRQK